MQGLGAPQVLHDRRSVEQGNAVLAPIDAASEPFVRSLVWTDFRVAVALFVVAPFALLAASVAARVPREPDDRSKSAETVLRLMTSYWQASSLLLLTVALNIQEANFGVFAGLAPQAMIVVSLWWWTGRRGELAGVVRCDVALGPPRRNKAPRGTQNPRNRQFDYQTRILRGRFTPGRFVVEAVF